MSQNAPARPATVGGSGPDHPQSPAWSALADRAIERLRAHHQRLAARREAPACDDTFAPGAGAGRAARRATGPRPDATPTAPQAVLAQLSRSPARRHLPPEAWDAIVAQGGDPFATAEDGRCRPQIELPLGELLLALRLAATFTSPTDLARRLAPGALTVLTGLDWPDRALLEPVLEHAILPDAWGATSRAAKIDDSGPCLRVFTDTARDDVLREALGARTPLLFALASDTKLPAAFSGALDQHLTLAPITPELLLTLLAATHSATGRIDAAAVRAALPSAAALARLTPEHCLIAARAPNARAVAERLAGFAGAVAQTPAPAPVRDLETLAQRSPAHMTAWRIVRDLVAWREGTVSWTDLTRSLLLHGAPGTGKTMLARMMGESAGVRVISSSFAAWQSAGHLGHMLAAMRRTFQDARTAAPCILFIDEIDAAGSRDDTASQNRSYQTQVINGFLEEVDRIAREPGVILVGACNDPNRLDPAILRPGRFDVKIEVPRPDRAFLEGMLVDALRGTLTPAELAGLARDAVGQTPADVDAAIRAARADARHRGVPLDADLLRHHLGASTIPPASLRRIALHEAGHAIAAHHIDPGSIRRIQVSGRAGEVDRTPPRADMLLRDLEAEIMVLLAGRAAEDVILGAASNGAGGSAGSDLARASALAAAIEHRYGLGHDGLLWTEAPLPGLSAPPDLRARLRKRLDTAARQARTLIRQHQGAVEALAARLEDERELAGEDLHAFLRSTATDATSAPTEAQPRPRPPQIPENSLLE
ncbi:AAA family ATPase [Paenirhodobacter sp. CAU 1674]|uniref:AAA family ATPase n=1 Tax=Paenirhodobacter sp. CAU 1674 TaxID=3032596 RepID=UPI0023DCEA99|nr:AAA family ATPase [Paenirhodobacter sp. CAU 1674]MDF2143265.1 AAA family ATPase [Paenirhodobacter sp. CAU 1674]